MRDKLLGKQSDDVDIALDNMLGKDFAEKVRSSLGDAKSSLGDAKSSLCDAKSSLGDAKSSLGDAKSSLGENVQVEWKDPADVSRGAKYIYLTEKDYKRLRRMQKLVATEISMADGTVRWRLDDLTGGLGMECLQVRSLLLTHPPPRSHPVPSMRCEPSRGAEILPCHVLVRSCPWDACGAPVGARIAVTGEEGRVVLTSEPGRDAVSLSPQLSSHTDVVAHHPGLRRDRIDDVCGIPRHLHAHVRDRA